MQKNRLVRVLGGLALSGAVLLPAKTALAVDFGDMMNPSKWFGGGRNRDYYDGDYYRYRRGGYGWGGPWGGYGYGGYPYYGGYPGYGWGAPGYGYGYGAGQQQQQKAAPPPVPE